MIKEPVVVLMIDPQLDATVIGTGPGTILVDRNNSLIKSKDHHCAICLG